MVQPQPVPNFFFSSRRRHTRVQGDWSSDVCSSDLGYYRVEILAALVNGVLLCVMAIGILFATYERLWQPPHVPGGPIVAVAVLGLLVNLAGLWLLHRGAGESLNVRSAYLEVMGDAISSGVVIVAGGVILLTGWAIAD